MTKFDAIVVGAGIIGSSTAYHLAKLGKRTLLLEKFALGHDRGSSHGKSRIIRYAHSTAPYIPLVHDAYNQWAELEKQSGEKLWSKTGLLWISDAPSTQTRSAVLKQFGFEHEILIGAEIGKRFPQFTYDDSWHALFDPMGGVVYADVCLRTIQSEFRKLGGTIHDNEKMVSYSSTNDEIDLKTDKSSYKSGKVVFCVGSWLPKLLPNIPIRCQPEQLALTFWRPQKNAENYTVGKFPCFIITNDDTKLHLFGQPCVDYPDQIKVVNDHGIHFNDADSIPDHSKKFDHEIVSKHLTEHFPDIDAKQPATLKTCLYTMTPDHDYIIDAHPTSKNVYIGGGFSGTGFKLGPAVGAVLAKMATGMNVDMDLKAFQLNR